MDIIEVIRYLNSADGPNIPLRTLAAYCGTDHGVLSQYLNGIHKPKEETIKKMEKGISEMVLEINNECKWLFNRRI